MKFSVKLLCGPNGPNRSWTIVRIIQVSVIDILENSRIGSILYAHNSICTLVNDLISQCNIKECESFAESHETSKVFGTPTTRLCLPGSSEAVLWL
jgi:hypothetical protein